MAANEGVVGALLWRGERHDAVQLAVGAERLFAPCQYLVAVGLVAHVPYYSVFGGVVNIVQCHGKLYCSEARGEVAGIYGQLVEYVFPQFVTDLRQPVGRQLAQVFGVLNVAQKA